MAPKFFAFLPVIDIKIYSRFFVHGERTVDFIANNPQKIKKKFSTVCNNFFTNLKLKLINKG